MSVLSNSSLISVIIIFLNAVDFLQEAIESVLAQTYEHWELLLVDDGSNDGSSEIARRYVSESIPQVHYFEHEGHQNFGMSASRNLGILHSKGDYIAFLDADDCWLPEKLETHFKILDMYPEADMLFGGARYWFSWTGHPDDIQRDYAPKHRVRAFTLFNPPVLLTFFLEGKTEIPSPSSMLVRAKAIKKVGGFEESFRGMYEDQAFLTKICLSSPVIATADCLTLYRQHSDSCSSIANKAGQIQIIHYAYLKWVESYFHAQNEKDVRLIQAIRRQLWLHNNPSHRWFPYPSPNQMRWIKKWVLRIEEHILPTSIRNQLWGHQ